MRVCELWAITYFSCLLPSANHALQEFKECFDYLQTLYDSLSADGFLILLGDFNGDLRNSLGDKVKRSPIIVVCYYLIC